MPIGVPSVPYRLPGSSYEQWINIYERLFRERIIFLSEEVDDAIANAIVAYLLYLDSDDPSKPIYLYINSPGDRSPLVWLSMTPCNISNQR